MKRTVLTGLLLAAVFAGGSVAAQGDAGYPNRPVRIIVPYSPGGATDIIARHIATRLSETTGQQFVVDNRAGASGNIALELAARATPDGYTLLVGNVSTNAINETTFSQSLKVKPSQDLAGITNLIEIPSMFAIHPGIAANDLKQFVEYAKRPGTKLNYGSAGIGTYPHLDTVVFARAAGIEATHVPFKGGAGQMIPGLIAGEVQFMFINLASGIPQVRGGRMKAIAVTSEQRNPDLPNVQTMAEQGYRGIGTNAWNGMFAPAGVPAPVLNRIHGLVVEILQRPEMKELLTKQLFIVSPSKSPAEYTKFTRAETAKWAKIVRENNIRIE